MADVGQAGLHEPWIALAQRCTGFWRIFERLNAIDSTMRFSREWFEVAFNEAASETLGWKVVPYRLHRSHTAVPQAPMASQRNPSRLGGRLLRRRGSARTARSPWIRTLWRLTLVAPRSR